jgi:hypothetical protein
MYFLFFKSLFYLVTFSFTYYFYSILFGPKNILLHFKGTILILINYLSKFHILITTKYLGHYTKYIRISTTSHSNHTQT